MSAKRNNDFRLVIAGVGGQGTLLASRILALSAIKAQMPVRVGETYGAAQRGGPVMGHVQIGGKGRGPQICPGEADALLGFEQAEAVRRSVTFLKKNGMVIMNSRRFPPAEVISGIAEYPKREVLMAWLGEITLNIIAFDATLLAKKAGDPITTNVVLIGALCATGLLPFREDVVLKTLKENIRPTYHETNLKAFNLGKKTYMNLIDQY